MDASVVVKCREGLNFIHLIHPFKLLMYLIPLFRVLKSVDNNSTCFIFCGPGQSAYQKLVLFLYLRVKLNYQGPGVSNLNVYWVILQVIWQFSLKLMVLGLLQI